MRDISADDVKSAEFVNNPLIVAGIDAEDDNEFETVALAVFEAMALFVSAKKGDTKGLADEVKEFVNNPLIVAGIDAEDDNEGFEAVALFVSAEEGGIKGLTDEVKESTEFVGTADIDDSIVFEDVSDPSNIVEDWIDVELAEYATVNVAKEETEVKLLDSDGHAVPEVETVFNPDNVGRFVGTTVEVIEIIW